MATYVGLPDVLALVERIAVTEDAFTFNVRTGTFRLSVRVNRIFYNPPRKDRAVESAYPRSAPTVQTI